MKNKKSIYKIKIHLVNIQPPIWRRILVNSDVLLPDLHKIIQTVMEWTNTHLHEFCVGKKIYGEIDEEDTLNTIDYSNIRLNKILNEINENIVYFYDFGDNWKHKITLEEILEQKLKQYYPVCIDGKRSAPPDDCGGSRGYEELLEILKNPDHPEYEEKKTWMGDEFLPEEFDIKSVNKLLHKKDYGCIIGLDDF